MPQALLFGRAPAGQNATGDSDWQNYYNYIHGQQEAVLQPALERLVHYVMIAKDGPFAGKELKDWKIEFTPLKELTEKEWAEIRKTNAETDEINVRTGIIHQNEARSRYEGSYSMEITLDTKYDDEATRPIKEPAATKEKKPKKKEVPVAA